MTNKGFTIPRYLSEVGMFISLNYVDLILKFWLDLYATFESHSILAKRYGQNFRISQHNFSDMNIPTSDKYLGIVNPLLIITNLQVDLDIPNLKAMCPTWLAVHRHRVKVCEMLLKITLMISSLRIVYTIAHEEIPAH